jgi:hypothetical protein
VLELLQCTGEVADGDHSLALQEHASDIRDGSGLPALRSAIVWLAAIMA